jgi:hypothetical protein
MKGQGAGKVVLYAKDWRSQSQSQWRGRLTMMEGATAQRETV